MAAPQQNHATPTSTTLPALHGMTGQTLGTDLSRYKRSNRPDLDACSAAMSADRSPAHQGQTAWMNSGSCPSLPEIPRTAHLPICLCDHSAHVKPCKSKKRKPAPDIIPIPPLPVSDRYPYRYSSAGPSKYEQTVERRKLRRCLDMLKRKQDIKDPLDLRFVAQKRGYFTTSMTNSLQLFQYVNPAELPASYMPKSLTTPLHVPFAPKTEFDRYLLDQLYPDWQTNPKYKRSLLFWVKNEEVAV